MANLDTDVNFFYRPHSIFALISVIVSLVYLANKKDVRRVLNFFDKDIGLPLPERSYADDCALTPETLWGSIDIFVIGHTLGWFAKAIVLRDYWFCWINSIMFEFMEYSLQHQLPNFAECWWDHWILDVMMTNWLGTYLGMKTCEFLEVKHYSWRGIKSITTYRGKMKRTIQQFTPHHWTKFEWGTTKTLKNFLAVLGLLYLMLQFEVNGFYLKYLLYIPVEHPINVVRLTFFFFVALPAVREGYQYLTDKECKRFGMHAWLAAANVLTELIVCIKFGQGEFNEPTPRHVLIGWGIGLTLFAIYTIWRFGFHKVKLEDYEQVIYEEEDEEDEEDEEQEEEEKKLIELDNVEKITLTKKKVIKEGVLTGGESESFNVG
ncbi:hypothetical protein HK099_008472, partial [Clydaea vesicula]